MSDNTIRCGLDGCISQQCESLGNHTWKGSTTVAGCLPTAVPTRTTYVSVWVDLDDRQRQPDELMIGIYKDPSGDDGIEAWMTVEEAERLHHLLGSAIRRHTAYRRIAP